MVSCLQIAKLNLLNEGDTVRLPDKQDVHASFVNGNLFKEPIALPQNDRNKNLKLLKLSISQVIKEKLPFLDLEPKICKIGVFS